MELNAATDYLGTNELLCDITVEQPVEGEFTIPDYQPEIFKIVKTKAEPVVVQKLAVGSRATVDGYVRLTVIYQSEEDKRLYASIQKLPFSKQIDLKHAAGENSTILYGINMSYINCRAVNQRRIDVRGAAAISVKVLSGSDMEIVGDVTGDGSQQRQCTADFMKQVGAGEKQFTLDEELALTFDGCEAPSVIRCDAKAYSETASIEGGRVVVAGSVNAAIALDISVEEEYRVKRASFNLPFNQIVDIDDADEAHLPTAQISVLSAAAEIEENGVIGISVLCALEVKMYKGETATFICDAFSTKYELDIERENVSLTRSVTSVHEAVSINHSIEKPVAGADLIDYYITSGAIEYVTNGDTACAEVSAVFSYMLSDVSGDIACWDYPFTCLVEMENPEGTAYKSLDMVIKSIECSDSDTTIGLKAEGNIYGTVIDVIKQPIVKSVAADTAKVKSCPDMAVAIYYADEGEDIFEIAKMFGTSPLEIINENNVADGVLEQRSMLLIPIVE